MSFGRICVLIAMGALLMSGCGGQKGKSAGGNPTDSSTNQMAERPNSANGIDPVHGHLLRAQPKLPTIKLWLGAEEVVAEIARQPVQIATGMMFRTNMLENEAMVFVFQNADRRNFYMRNCVVPLSAAYISPEGVILEIVNLNPGDEVGVSSQSANVQFVVESPQGWYARHGVKPGMVIRTERGSLQETFFGKYPR